MKPQPSRDSTQANFKPAGGCAAGMVLQDAHAEQKALLIGCGFTAEQANSVIKYVLHVLKDGKISAADALASGVNIIIQDFTAKRRENPQTRISCVLESYGFTLSMPLFLRLAAAQGRAGLT